MATYSIKDLETLSGIKAHTLRIWEQRYQTLIPHRTETNIRFYDDEQLKYLLNISLLLENGAKISKISKLSIDEIKAEINKLLHDPKGAVSNLSVAAQVNSLVLAMIELNEKKFEKVFSTNLMRKGFEKTITEIIYPFLHKVGLMWTINEINPAQEHFISMLIRQKLVVAIDSLEIPSSEKNAFLLYLPEKEYHEIGLLLSNYYIRNAGFKTFYLGQNVPLIDLEAVIETTKPQHILTFLTSPFSTEIMSVYMNKLNEVNPEIQFLISGSAVDDSIELKHNNHWLQTPDELFKYLKALS